jgi:hypothetical protein
MNLESTEGHPGYRPPSVAPVTKMGTNNMGCSATAKRRTAGPNTRT